MVFDPVFDDYLKEQPEDTEKYIPGLPRPYTQQERASMYGNYMGREQQFTPPPEPTKTDYNVVPPSQRSYSIGGFTMGGAPMRWTPSKYDVQRSINSQMRYQETEQRNREMMDTGGETYDQRNARLFNLDQAAKNFRDTQRERTKALVAKMIETRKAESERAEKRFLDPIKFIFGMGGY